MWTDLERVKKLLDENYERAKQAQAVQVDTLPDAVLNTLQTHSDTQQASLRKAIENERKRHELQITENTKALEQSLRHQQASHAQSLSDIHTSIRELQTHSDAQHASLRSALEK